LLLKDCLWMVLAVCCPDDSWCLAKTWRPWLLLWFKWLYRIVLHDGPLNQLLDRHWIMFEINRLYIAWHVATGSLLTITAVVPQVQGRRAARVLELLGSSTNQISVDVLLVVLPISCTSIYVCHPMAEQHARRICIDWLTIYVFNICLQGCIICCCMDCQRWAQTIFPCQKYMHCCWSRYVPWYWWMDGWTDHMPCIACMHERYNLSSIGTSTRGTQQ